MRTVIVPAKKLSGKVTVPADKSISHRALLIGSMAKGTTEIENLLEAADVLSTKKCLENLGVAIKKENRVHSVTGQDKFGYKKPENPLDVGNSGTTLRILPGILAGQDFKCEMFGDASVNSRPVERVLKPLRKMGALAQSTQGHAPLTIAGGKLKGIEYRTEVPSAQVKSAILLAGLLAEGKTKVTEEYRSRDHTEIMLENFGAGITVEGNSVTVDGNSELTGTKVKVPGDFSSGAYFLSAAALVKDSQVILENVGINPLRSGLLEVLRRMGCDIEVIVASEENAEKTASLISTSCELSGTKITKEEVPSMIDELPLVAVLASQAQGTTVVTGASELRVKETDRIKTVAGELNKMGAAIKEKEDGFIVEGPAKLKGAVVDSHGDHRLAMALAVAGLTAERETVIENSEAVQVSFPGFFKVLESILVR